LPLNLSAAVVILGVISGQCANPLHETELQLVLLPALSVYFLALAMPAAVYNLTFSKDYEAGWVLRGAPLLRPVGLARGACKAVMLIVIGPSCLVLAVTLAVIWGDVLSGLLHGVLAGLLAWLLALSGLWLVAADLPFTQPPARGSSLAPAPVPMALFGAVLS